MDESDLFRALSTSPAQFLKQSTAPGPTVLDIAKNVVLTHKPEIIGAGVLTAVGALASMKDKSGTSFLQRRTRPTYEASEKSMEAYRKAKIDPGFVKKLELIGARVSKDLADLMAEHPIASAITLAPVVGWQAGGTVGRALASHPDVTEAVKNTFRR